MFFENLLNLLGFPLFLFEQSTLLILILYYLENSWNIKLCHKIQKISSTKFSLIS